MTPRRAGWTTALYWAALVACLGALLAPLWVGVIPPLTDFGGHLQLADAWATLHEDPLLATYLQRKDTWLAPNLLSARFVGLVYPLLEPLTALRLLYTLAMAAVAASTAWTLHVFGRSRWLLFLALPALWGWTTGLGLVNYLLAVAGLVAAVPVARRVALDGGWRPTLALAALGLAAFWTHGIGFAFTAAMAAGVLVLSAPGWHRLIVGAAALTPSVALWGYWFLHGRTRVGGESLMGAVSRVDWGGAMEKAETLVHARDVTTSDTDLLVAWVVGLCWLALMGLSRRAEADEPPGAGLLVRLGAWTRANTLLLVALALAAGVLLAPRYVYLVAISDRLLLPLGLVVAMLPRLPRRSPAAAVPVAVAIAASLALGGHLVRQAALFQAHEIAPLVEIVDRIPPGQRARCFEVRSYTPRFFRHRPLQHACDGLLQARAGAYAGGGFAYTGYNAVTWRYPDLVQLLQDREWRSWTKLRWWDYAVVRGDHSPPNPAVAEVVYRTEPAPWSTDTVWTLYKAAESPRQRSVAESIAGGPGGLEVRWTCRPGRVLTGIRTTRDARRDRMVSVTPICEGMQWAEGKQPFRPDGDEERGPLIGGDGGRPRTRRCGAGQVLVGLEGRHHDFVERLDVVCARPGEPAPLAEEEAAQKTAADAGDEQPDDAERPFLLRCPRTSVATAIHGRVGAAVDAVGVACTRLEDVLAHVPRPEPKPEPILEYGPPAPPEPKAAPRPKRDRRRAPPVDRLQQWRGRRLAPLPAPAPRGRRDGRDDSAR